MPAQPLLLLSLWKTCRRGDVHETSTAPNVSDLATLQPLSPNGFASAAAASTQRPRGGIPRVEYQLTEKGLALLPIIEAMRRFGHVWLVPHHDHSTTPIG